MKPLANLLQYKLGFFTSQIRKKGDDNNTKGMYIQSSSQKTYVEVHNHKILLIIKTTTNF
jgi:hypothetical protein